MNALTGNEVLVVAREEWGADLGLVEGDGAFREIVGPRLGARERSMHHVSLGAGARTVGLTHPGDAVYYIAEGTAVVRAPGGEESGPLTAGAMVHIAGGSSYSLSSDGGAILLGGPSPVDPGLYDGRSVRSMPGASSGISVHHQDQPGLMVPFISSDARLVVWLGSGARTANMNYVVLEPGERNKEHVHRYSEDTIHILEGRGTAEDLTHGLRLPVGPGDTVHIKPGTWHAVTADRGERVVSVGGPCPADLDMLRAVGVDVDALVGTDDVVVASGEPA
ncbi:cupin domain-containing protein [Geodermatophilus sp. DF01_2]|uniref:cupin domain-containing protein n=1 Tax=Geodermatophilus sp. DF01-2 TaxID=2559610 RepID=UPI0014301431|nr:cupin domain-containing protein [Geodermatophilus sp. DF01_2]